jgi:hypothetical protein
MVEPVGAADSPRSQGSTVSGIALRLMLGAGLFLLAIGLGLVGCFLILGGLQMLLGAFFIGPHGFMAAAIFVFLGLFSLVGSGILMICCVVPILGGLRDRWFQLRHGEARRNGGIQPL